MSFSELLKTNLFDPFNHAYVEHETYSGPGCARCGKERSQHLYDLKMDEEYENWCKEVRRKK